MPAYAAKIFADEILPGGLMKRAVSSERLNGETAIAGHSRRHLAVERSQKHTDAASNSRSLVDPGGPLIAGKSA